MERKNSNFDQIKKILMSTQNVTKFNKSNWNNPNSYKAQM